MSFLRPTSLLVTLAALTSTLSFAEEQKPMMAIVNGKDIPMPAVGDKMGDEYTLARILDEGKNRNQVMDHLAYLTKKIGPRLTGSTGVYIANQWCRDQYAIWGLHNPHLEQWGEIGVGFDRGPSVGKLLLKKEVRPARDPNDPNRPRRGPRPDGTTPGAAPAAPAAPGATGSADLDSQPATKPDTQPDARPDAQPETPPGVKPDGKPEASTEPKADAKPEDAKGDEKVDTKSADARKTEPKKYEYETIRDLTFTTLAWTPGTNGPVRGIVLKEPKTEEEYAAVKDKIKGAWILIKAPPPAGQRGVRGQVQGRYEQRKDARKKAAEGKAIAELPVAERLLFDEPAGFISTSRDERVWTGSVNGWRDFTLDTLPQDVQAIVKQSDYDAINSRLADGETIEIEFDLKHNFFTGTPREPGSKEGGTKEGSAPMDKAAKVPVFNTVAEIRGTTWPEQFVIVSAHLDSWNGPGSEGCTDNGTGTSVTLEAARILMAAGAQPKRTIRFCNWTGEEQGLLGSKGYAEKHKEELPFVSAVFVDDGGTNYEGGLQCIASMADMLAAATAPVNGQFFDAVTNEPLKVNIKINEKMPRGGSSDHASFNAKGVPGFFWDEVGRADYGYGWHTQHDKLDLAIPEYLKQSATCAAVTAYRLACADTMLPREPKEEKKDTESKADAPKPEAAKEPAAKQ